MNDSSEAGFNSAASPEDVLGLLRRRQDLHRVRLLRDYPDEAALQALDPEYWGYFVWLDLKFENESALWDCVEICREEARKISGRPAIDATPWHPLEPKDDGLYLLSVMVDNALEASLTAILHEKLGDKIKHCAHRFDRQTPFSRKPVDLEGGAAPSPQV